MVALLPAISCLVQAPAAVLARAVALHIVSHGLDAQVIDYSLLIQTVITRQSPRLSLTDSGLPGSLCHCANQLCSSVSGAECKPIALAAMCTKLFGLHGYFSPRIRLVYATGSSVTIIVELLGNTKADGMSTLTSVFFKASWSKAACLGRVRL